MVRIPFSRMLRDYVVGSVKSSYLRREGWVFSPNRVLMFGELDSWLCNYAPVNLRGKVVLDVGCGEGESALFFLCKGARRVVGVESDENCFRNLRVNASRFPIDVVARRFSVCDLFRDDIDFFKVDIEGYEESILGYEPSVAGVVEVHGLQLRDRFVEAGWRVGEVKPFHCVCYAFWKC